jgi:hypothetical protein
LLHKFDSLFNKVVQVATSTCEMGDCISGGSSNGDVCKKRAAILVANRIILSNEQAFEINKIKLSLICSNPTGELRQHESFAKMKGKSTDVGKIYNVSPKTVRDIWNHITWKCATRHLWTELEASGEYKRSDQTNGYLNDGHSSITGNHLSGRASQEPAAKHRRPGRPIGSKDLEPRKNSRGHLKTIQV